MNEKLFKTLKHFIENSNRFTIEMRNALIEYKNSGGPQNNAQITAEQVRAYFADSEIKENIVLEILDVIMGWCSPDLKIWN